MVVDLRWKILFFLDRKFFGDPMVDSSLSKLLLKDDLLFLRPIFGKLNLLIRWILALSLSLLSSIGAVETSLSYEELCKAKIQSCVLELRNCPYSLKAIAGSNKNNSTKHEVSLPKTKISFLYTNFRANAVELGNFGVENFVVLWHKTNSSESENLKSEN